jgi:DNA-binding response OmpR family regulator
VESSDAPLALVVDDDPGVLAFLSAAVSASGWRTLTLMRGDLVLDTARRERPSLVLLDVQMPATDGLSILARLRGDPDLASVRVVLVSGEPEDVHGAIARELGADDFLEKPVLLTTIFRVLAESDPRAVIAAGRSEA